MKILFIYPSSKSSACGNVRTVTRIQQHLISQDTECISCDTSTIIGLQQNGACNYIQLERYVNKNGIDGVLFLHAFKGAKILLCGCKECLQDSSFIPYGVIFGGTDLNVDIKDEEKCLTMQKVLVRAKFAVAFTEAMKVIALNISPQLNVFVQPQAISPVNFEGKNILYTDRNFNMVNNNKNIHGFLMVTGIRPVKDPMFLLQTWITFSEENPHLELKLLILGPVLDSDYANLFFNLLSSLQNDWITNSFVFNNVENLELGDLNGFTFTNVQNKDLNKIYEWFADPHAFPILYSSALPRDDLDKLMHSPFIFASINSSESEGMASAILESMANKIPVIVRDNSGNKSLVEENKTGLLFHTCQEFVKQATKLIENPNLKRRIIDNAYKRILDHHSLIKEKAFYLDVCRNYFPTKEILHSPVQKPDIDGCDPQ